MDTHSHGRGQAVYPLQTAAQLVGLSPRTLRGYEEAGLIRPLRIGGNEQRMYSEQDLHWLRCIRDMIHDEGLTVTAIRRLADLIPCWEIRHCAPATALQCAPHLNIPGMAKTQVRPIEEAAECCCEAEASLPEAQPDAVEVVVIYGVEELGGVLPCSRCIRAERTVRRVALRYPGKVKVAKYDVGSPEAARWAGLMVPAVIVGDEVVSSGSGAGEDKLEAALERQLERIGERGS